MKALQASSWPVRENFREQAYSCVIHGEGMCDEYPRPFAYDAVLKPGMVICVESYIGSLARERV
ncbi:hypothetical protein [Mesorhizobium sp.]|uniref:hypothetical protein n=1 Tax=Mesorhizobium sp. TaxID=1871066 RepID=UPI0025799577|nr:hypothetical protein [Mesorhizobium sp.]